MNYLLEIGISEKDINDMITINADIINISITELKQKIELLKQINCTENMIINIITTNPMYLSRNIDDLINLFQKLTQLGIKRMDITFDSNPWLLNYDSFEIEDFIKEKLSMNISYDDIIDLIDKGNIED